MECELEQSYREDKCKRAVDLSKMLSDYIIQAVGINADFEKHSEELLRYTAETRKKELAEVMEPLKDWFNKWFGDVDAQLVIDKNGAHICQKISDL